MSRETVDEIAEIVAAPEHQAVEIRSDERHAEIESDPHIAEIENEDREEDA